MTEKEKKNRQEFYNFLLDETLNEEMLRCKDLCHTYNQLKLSQIKEQKEILSVLLGGLGEKVTILAPFWCDYGYNIEVGDNFYANHNLVILDGAKVVFGSNVMIGPDCGFYTATHPKNAELRAKGLEKDIPIMVGNDVWIGGGCRIMPGVTIGDDVIVGSGSVVTQDIPAHVIAAGNPCRIIKSLR